MSCCVYCLYKNGKKLLAKLNLSLYLSINRHYKFPTMYFTSLLLFTVSIIHHCNTLPIISSSIQDHQPEESDLFEGDILLLNNKRDKRMTMQDIAPSNSIPAGTAGGAAAGTGIFGDDNASLNETEEFKPEQVSGVLWPNQVVYYTIDDSIDNLYRQIYITAIEAWEYYTCLRFVKADSNTKAYLNLTVDAEGSCSSYIGRIGTEQKVTISHRCNGEGHAMHEIGHAIGLWHEHTRSDRNKYIKIIWDNIDEERAYNFLIYNHPEQDVEYDFGSIMHYENNAFAIDRTKPTIEILYQPLPKCLPEMGQRDMISFKDALKVNKLYQCTDELSKKEPDPCPLPEPISPSVTITPSQTSTTASSSSLIKPTPTCTNSKALKSGDSIAFSFSDALSLRIGCSGEYCNKEECTEQDPFARAEISCKTQYFKVYLASNKKNRYIKDGDTIALRSTVRTQHWIDCSRGNCSLTTCPDNIGKNITNYSRDICSQHKFKIHIVGTNKPKKRQRVKVTDLIYLESLDKYINCNGRKCKLVTDNGNDCEEFDNSGSSGYHCTKQTYYTEKAKKC